MYSKMGLLWNLCLERAQAVDFTKIILMAEENIEVALQEIESELDQLVNEESLQSELIEYNKPTFKQLSEFQIKDDEIVKELEELKNSWVVGNFIKEIQVNLEIYELESVASSLDKLAGKIEILNNEQVQSLAQGSINQLRDDFIKLLESVWSELLSISADELAFNAEVDHDGTVIEYKAFVDLVTEGKWLNLHVSKLIDGLIINKLVSNNYAFILNDNKLKYSKVANQDINGIIQSVVSIINFISRFPDSLKIIHYITTRFYDWLKSVVIDNVELIYNNTDLQDDFLNLNEFLISHGFKRDDLRHWIKSELNEFILEFYLESHVDEIRKLFAGLDTSAFETFTTQNKLELKPVETARKDKKHNVPEVAETKPEEDNDWDAWDDDFEFNDDDSKYDNQQKKPSNDDDWETWGEEDNENQSRLQQSKSKRKLHSKLSKSKSATPSPSPQPPTKISTNQRQANTTVVNENDYQTTSVTSPIIKIFDSFISKRSTIPSVYQSTYETKLSQLCIAYYMISLESYENKFLLYNDMQYLSSFFNIPNLFTLAETLLTETVKERESQIFKTLDKLNGLDPSIPSKIQFKIVTEIDGLFVDFMQQMKYLSKKLRTIIVIASIDSLYQKIIDMILSKVSIGEDESEYLSTIISKFLDLSIISQNGIESQAVPNYSKIIHVQFILKSHLKDIMNSFYNAEFFDLSTMELISLIDKMFADSALKRANIQEIRDIREME